MSYDTKDMRAALADHRLRLLEETPTITAYYLEKPGEGRMMSTLILFTPEGIALMGDLTPERNGSISSIGYDRAWFAGKNNGDYLCEKFLPQQWVLDYALAELRDPDGEWQSYAGTDSADSGLDDVILSLAAGERSWEWLHDELSELGFDMSEGVPGFGYEPTAAGWLCAIQRRFAELYTDQPTKGE